MIFRLENSKRAQLQVVVLFINQMLAFKIYIQIRSAKFDRTIQETRILQSGRLESLKTRKKCNINFESLTDL